MNEDMIEKRRQNDRWHLRKEIQISHIITMVLIILSGVAAYFDLDKRIDKEKDRNTYQDERFEEHLNITNHNLVEIKKDVRDIRNTVINKYNNH